MTRAHESRDWLPISDIRKCSVTYFAFTGYFNFLHKSSFSTPQPPLPPIQATDQHILLFTNSFVMYKRLQNSTEINQFYVYFSFRVHFETFFLYFNRIAHFETFPNADVSLHFYVNYRNKVVSAMGFIPKLPNYV